MYKFILTLGTFALMLDFSVASPICNGIDHNEDTIAAFAVVSASDGYVNVRQVNNKIINQLKNGQIVFIFEPTMNKRGWCEIDSPVSGRVHESGLKLTESFANVPTKKRNKYSVIFTNKDVEVTLKAVPFDKKKHKVVTKGEWHHVISIDGQKEWYGTDGTMPISEYTEIEVKFPDKTLVLPKRAYQNLLNPVMGDYDNSTNLAASVNYDKKNDVLFVHISNSDGAGSYYALLVVKNKRFDGQYVGIGF